MAKQEGVIKITGTIGNITFYKMNGGYYARSKSSLTGKRVKKDPNYYRFRMYSSRMACSSATAAKIYRSLRNEERDVSLYRRMVSEGMRLLRAGCAQERLEETLRAMFFPVAANEMIPLPENAVRSGVCVDAHGKLGICAKNTVEVNEDFTKMRLYLQHIHSLISVNYETKACVVSPAYDDLRQRVFPDQ